MRKHPWILGILLLGLLAGTTIATAPTPLTYEDEHIGHMDWRDLKFFKIWDNGTHLFMAWEWWGPPPIGDEPYHFRTTFTYLDIDNNRYTGSMYGRLQYYFAGAEILMDADKDYVYTWTYDATGHVVRSEPHWNWVYLANETMLIVSIPLDQLNLTNGDTIAVLHSESFASSADYAFSVAANWTVPYANITIDGDDADWAGIMPFATDNGSLVPESIDNMVLEEQYANLTEAYVASNGTHLFLAFRMGGPFNSALNDYNHWYLVYGLWVNVDNDETWDYDLRLEISRNSGQLHLYNFASESSGWYKLDEGNFSGLDSGFVEVAIYPPLLGLPENMTNRNITIYVGWMGLDVEDFVVKPFSKIFYTVGVGGYTTMPSLEESGQITQGVNNLVLGDLNLTLEALGDVDFHLWEYSVEPTGNASLPGTLSHGNYYVLWFKNPNNIVWPIHVEFASPGGVLMYYDKSVGAYVPVADQVYDQASGVIRANLTYDEYLAGDEPVLVAVWSPTVVGGRLLQLQPMPRGTLALLAALATIILLAVTLAARKMHG